ncbi:elongation factor G [Parasporobacterium paucivorans]|uniref:Elongation factor G n=1 Tax=Parasporobacterium paucivorans DSM 15970 TaxID=1122934 RepID=A0A1M6ER08_9FIRM|nr:elongation factor G [Parasporobacterium paucivorans]SHI87868.1 elongation factor G [Parasporobacterium paucivorans DSM 15970]
MNVYKTDNIRNVIVMGHGSSGKTSLTEAMAYTTGIVNRLGKVTDGNTISDFDKEEIKRKFSINTSVIPIEFNGIKINILDAPGYFDFVGEMEEAMSVADGAVICVSAKAGVEVGTVKAWEYCERYSIPRIFYISFMDDPNADFMKLVNELKNIFGKKVAPFHLPIIEEGKFVGYVNTVRMAGRKYRPDGSYDECEIPDNEKEDLAPVRDMIMEAVAETSEEYMERFFNGEEFSFEEIVGALRNEIFEGNIVPVQIGSSINNFGARMVLETIERYFPAPDKAKFFRQGINTATKEPFIATCDHDGPLAVFVFKTILDPFIGAFSLVKISSGILKSDDTVYNAERDAMEKISKLYVLRGKTTTEIKELHGGDIGAIPKLSVTRTGDTLSKKEFPIILNKPKMSVPYTSVAYTSKVKGEEDKIAQAISKMTIEDLTLKQVNDEENRQMLLYGVGDQHLEIVASKIKDNYKVDIEIMHPRVAFRETIRKKVETEGKHKKQSGGHGQYGHVKMSFEPSNNLDKPYEFEEKIFGGSVPKNYFPAVEKGIQECVQKGPLAGYPVVGIKGVLLDGSYHPVDSSEMAFKMATIHAFKKGFMEASPVLLEPIALLKVTIPDRFTGDIMGDLNKKRGRVMGMNPTDNGKQVIEAEIPMSELFGYSTNLRSMTGGYGNYEYAFVRYEQAPPEVQQHEIARHEAEHGREV